jgi:hypothetical protein
VRPLPGAPIQYLKEPVKAVYMLSEQKS